MTPNTTTDTTSDTYHHGDLQRALLRAVGEIVDEAGLGALSLREAARRAGVSHSAPAHHFGSKEGLLDAFAIEGFELLGARFDAATAGIDRARPVDVLDALGRAYLSFAVEDAAHYEVMFSHARADEEWHETDLSVAADDCFDQLAEAVRLLVVAGYVAESNARYVATMLWGTCHGIAELWNDGKLPHFYEDHTFDGVLDGVMGVIRGLLEQSTDVGPPPPRGVRGGEDPG